MFSRKSSRYLKLANERIHQEAIFFLDQLNEANSAYEVLKSLPDNEAMKPYAAILYKTCKSYQIEEYFDYLQAYFSFINKPTVKKWKMIYNVFIQDNSDQQLNLDADIKSQFSDINNLISNLNLINASCYDCLNDATWQIFQYFHLNLMGEIIDTVKANVQQYVMAQTGKALQLGEQRAPNNHHL